MTKTATNAEQRTMITSNANFRAATDEADGKKYLQGYFIRFNEETNLYGNIFETISPNAVDDDIADKDVLALFDHDSAKVLGRTKAGTLTVKKDKEGVFGRVLINENDPEALSIYAKVQRGDVSSASFGFFMDPDTVQVESRDDGTLHTVVTEADVYEISVVTFPAYPTTEISARKRDLDHIVTERFAARKQKLIKRIKGGKH